MKQKLKHKFARNDDIYSFVFHLLSFVIFQYYQIENHVALEIDIQALSNELFKLQQDKYYAARVNNQKWNMTLAMFGCWSTLCCSINNPPTSKTPNMQVRNVEASYDTNSEGSVELGHDKVQENITVNEHLNANGNKTVDVNTNPNVHTNAQVNINESDHEGSVIIHNDRDHDTDMACIPKIKSRYRALKTQVVDDEVEDSTANRVHMVEYLA